jgi:sugar lactone lactonase YvrE
MNKFLINTLLVLLLASCSNENESKLEVFITGAKIAGVNGMHFGPDGYLYAASVIGSDITVIDTEDNRIVKRYGISEGVIGPDDIAFNSKGEFFWTSILTGEVAGFNTKGEKVIAGNPGPGVNPITFSDDDRLFVAQCFFDNGLFELDSNGMNEPRIIFNEIGEFCGLNGMDWGPDGRLYGPRWFNNEVVSVDVDTGDIRKEAGGFTVPAAIKFNSKGELFVLDTGAGKVVKVLDGKNSDYAFIENGLDNLAFNEKDELFVSSYSEGYVLRVTENTVEAILPGGISHAGGITIIGNDIVVADIQSVKAYNTQNGTESWNYKNTFRVSPMGANTSVSTYDNNLILTSWLDGHVKVMRPDNGEIIESLDGLNIPVSATKFNNQIAIAMHGDKSITLHDFKTGINTVLVDGFVAPTHVINYGDKLLVSDRGTGQLLSIDTEGDKNIVVEGLNSPEGIAIKGASIYVFEGDTGEIKKIKNNNISVIARVNSGSKAQSNLQPPSMVFNGLAIQGDYLYVSGELEKSLFRIKIL